MAGFQSLFETTIARWLPARPTGIAADGGGESQSPIEAAIERWHGIIPPNEPAKRLAADLAATILAFEAVRGTLVFEDEPSSFEAALLSTKDAA
jgi:hypothetical protein